MEYCDINIDFIKRTVDIINDYDGQYEVTLLLNCCTGLLVLPKEVHNNLIPNLEIPVTGSIWGLKRSYLSFGSQGDDYTLSYIIRRLRNGICHFKVQTLPDGSGNISTLIINDFNGSRSSTDTFKAELPISALKELVNALACHVLQHKAPSSP